MGVFASKTWAMGLTLGITCVLGPLALIRRMRAKGSVRSVWLSDRRGERPFLHALVLAVLLTSLFWIRAMGAPPIVQGASFAALASALCVTLLLPFFRPSIHCAGNAGIGTALCFYSLPAGILVLLLLPPTALCRLRSGAHTPAEVAAGILVGAGATAAAMGWWRL